MTDQFDAPQPDPKRDRYGRYMLPDPTEPGSATAPWTRATTFAKSISDSFGLTNWQLRMAVKGVAMRPDLYALAASAPIEDKSTLDRVAKDAKEAAAASSGANQGTAVHTFTERIDRGEQITIPEPWGADVDSYRAAMAAAQITPLPQWIERIVVVRQLKVAGTLDRIVRTSSGDLVIGDLKTGKDLSYGWLEIAIQLALYAHADAIWNGITDRYEPMPQVNQQTALVMHTPVGKAQTTLYQVDIAAGWEAAQTVAAVREWRSRKALATPWADPEPVIDRIHRSIVHRDLTQQIKAAASESDLIALWTEATAAGTWGTVHTRAASLRKQELYANQA